jgi:hypothetical protein
LSFNRLAPLNSIFSQSSDGLHCHAEPGFLSVHTEITKTRDMDWSRRRIKNAWNADRDGIRSSNRACPRCACGSQTIIRAVVAGERHVSKTIAECDQQLQKQLANLSVTNQLLAPQTKRTKAKKPAKNAPRFDLGSELQRVTGVDLTRIDGIDVMTAQTLLSEVGLDMSRWKTESHFASWLGLCPDNRVSGDKVLGRGTRRVVNRAATALRQAANTLMRSHTYLGAQYRRLRTRLGAPKAITAMAHRLARLVYRMLKYGQAYVDKGSEYYEERFRQQQIQSLRKRAAGLGLQLTETQPRR